VRAVLDKAGLQAVPGKLAYCETTEDALALVGVKLAHYRRQRLGPIRLHLHHRPKLSVARATRTLE
jgi:hypothetical protein